MNAVQRRYPQIYKSNDRLLLKPETIEVELRDFMISVKSAYLMIAIPAKLCYDANSVFFHQNSCLPRRVRCHQRRPRSLRSSFLCCKIHSTS